MYDKDYEYANSRLEGTIVRNGKQPVKVLCVNANGTVHAETVITAKRKEFHLDELDLSSPPLGMPNTASGAVYLARKPMRRDCRQGLRSNNITCLNKRIEITSRLIYGAILGRYPTLALAIDDCMTKGISVAFHREWSVSWDERKREVVLNYKWHKNAGVIDPDTNMYELKDGEDYLFTHLHEALDEVIHAKD